MDLLELPLPACMVSASLSLCGLRERRAGQRSPGPHLLYASGIHGEPLPCLPWGCLLTSKTGKLNTHEMVQWGVVSQALPASWLLPQPLTCPDRGNPCTRRGELTDWREFPAEGREDQGFGVPAALPGMEMDLAGIQISLQIRSKCKKAATLPFD